MMGREHKSGLVSDLSMSDFVRSYERGVDGLITFFNIWSKVAHERSDIQIFKYEDFLGDWATNNLAWTRFVEFITNQPVDNVLLSASVQQYKIENLKENISSNRADLMGLGGRIRSGRSGGYQSALDVEDVSFINTRLELGLSQH
jgi:hypothetical protein